MPRRLLVALTGLLLTIFAPLGVAADFRILRYESVVVSEAAHPPSLRGATVRGSAVRFRAFGTDFALDLAPNDRINGALPAAQRDTIVALRGTVVGKPGSWVRFTRDHGRLTGLLFDGRELYSIATTGEVRGFIRNPVGLPADAEPVIYRLRDTLTELEGDFCGVAMVPGVSTQAEAFQALTAQMQSYDIAALTATKQLELGMLGDFELWSIYGDRTAVIIATRMNIVDGIFSSQVGVHLSVRSITTFPTDTDPFDTNDSSDLLNELRTYRTGTPAQFQNAGVTHLMTGRDIASSGNASTVGIAFVGALCGNAAVSISEGRRSDNNTAALITAHELGHNFGAQHDGEAGGACPSTPTTFIMSAQLNVSNSASFSDCSLNTMSAFVTGSSTTSPAACLATVALADAALDVPASAPLALDQATVVSFNVKSLGPGAIGDVQVAVGLPPGITIAGAGAVGGTCQTTQTQIACALPSIPAGEQREVQLSLIGRAVGSSIAVITITAAGDASSGNNTASLSLVTDAAVDVSVSVATSSAAIDTNSASVATITVSNLSATAATGTRLTATLPTGLAAVSAAANSLGCSVDGSGAFACTSVTLAANTAQSVALTVRGTSAGARRLNVAVTSQLGDPNAANNSAGVTFTVTDPVVVVPPPATGGGGRLGGELAALGVALAWQLGRRRRLSRSASYR